MRGFSLDRKNTAVLEGTMWKTSRTAMYLNIHCSYNNEK